MSNLFENLPILSYMASCLDIRFDPSAALQRLTSLKQGDPLLVGPETPLRKALGPAILPLTLLPGTAPLTHWLLCGKDTEVVRLALHGKLQKAQTDFGRLVRGRTEPIPLYELVEAHHRRDFHITPPSPLEFAAISGDATLPTEAIPMLIGVMLHLIGNRTATVSMDTFHHEPKDPFKASALPFGSPDVYGPGFPPDFGSINPSQLQAMPRILAGTNDVTVTTENSHTKLSTDILRTIRAYREILQSLRPRDQGLAIPRVMRRMDAELQYNMGLREGSHIGLEVLLPSGGQEQQIIVHRRLVADPGRMLPLESVDPHKIQILFVPGHALFVSGWAHGFGGLQELVDRCALVVQIARLELSRGLFGLPEDKDPLSSIEQEAGKMVRGKKITVLRKDKKKMTVSICFEYKGRELHVLVDLSPTQSEDSREVPAEWRLTFPSTVTGTPPIIVSSKSVNRETIGPLRDHLLRMAS